MTHRDWLWVSPGGEAMRFGCDRCESVMCLLYPVAITDSLDALKAFSKRHRQCRPTLRSERRNLLVALRRRADPTPGSVTFSLVVK